MSLEIVQLGASRLSDSGLPIITAINAIGNDESDAEHFGEVDHFNGLGLTARPYPKSDRGHAEGLVERTVPGTTGVAFSGRDERCADMYASLAPGDTVLHATGPSHAAQLMCKEDGTVTALTTDDGTSTGRSVFSQVRSDAHRWIGPWGKVTFDAGGWHLLHHAGARIDVGGIGGVPAPLDSLGAYVNIRAPIIKIEGAAIALGASAGLAEPIAKATSTLTVLSTIAAALQGINAALIAIAPALTPGSPAGVAAGAIGAATALILTSTAAIATGIVTIPSASTSVT